MSELNFTGEYVDKISVNMTGRSFQVFGSDGSCQTVICDDTDQFMAVLKVVRKAEDIDEQVEVVYN
tara:strand:- start:62 stop:259 length:198 start_codon:yes stop_codon:yes gene_type:complete